MRKTVFPTLIAVSMIMLVVTPVLVSANVSMLSKEQSYKLPLKGFVRSLQWNQGNSPDLAVYNNEITFNPTSPTPEETVKITAIIHNEGDTHARRVKVGFYDGTPSAETLIGTKNIGYLRAGTSETIFISWTAEAGTHEIYVAADPYNSIFESNETNNVAYNTIFVGTPTPNQPPVADAGPDQTVTDTDGNGIEDVTLDGTGSYDPDGDVISYEWKEGENVLGTDPIITVSFNVEGSPHTVTLTVTDDDSATDSNICIITVQEAGVIEKWALLIGISDYQGTENDLWNPHKDALDMHTALTTLYDFPEDHIHMLLNEDATMEAILTGINWLSNVEDSPDDVVVFFFCGHGHRVLEWDRQWRNADGDRESDRRDEFIVSHDLWAYADGYLAEDFAAFDSDNLFLWFGSCYSGGMDDIYKKSGFSGVICTACKENQYGFDVLEFNNTLFGEFYVDQGILQGQGDKYGNEDGITTVEEAFYYAQPLVSDWAKENTHYSSDPQIYDTEPASDFYL